MSNMKSLVVGVSVTPEVGLEVAQIDFATQTVLKYGIRKLEYDNARREIADLDLFKEALQDLFMELAIAQGSTVVINIPTVTFKVNDYPAALEDGQISNALEEDIADHPILKNTDPAISAVKLPNSSMQFNKIAYVAAQKQMLIEMALIIKDLGYKLYAIDTSVNSVLNALMYKQRVDVSEDVNWVLLTVDNTHCRILSMNGKDYVDCIEEKISIGEVLGDAENYATVVATVTPILNNVPSKYLCVVSKTNVISAELLASKLTYSAPITYQEANCFSKEAFLEYGPEVDEKMAMILSLDVIGACIYRDFERYSDAHFNLFNESLGEVYLLEQPPEIILFGHKFVLSNQFLITLFCICAVVLGLVIGSLFIFYSTKVANLNEQVEELDNKANQIEQYLKANENISTELFDEGDEIRGGLVHNKNIYSYYTIVGTEIPKKLWLTHLKFGDKTTIEGQADNLESVYAFFRSIKDYNPDSDIKLQKLGLASKSTAANNDLEEINTDSILTSLNADFYEFAISNDPDLNKKEKKEGDNPADGNNNVDNALPGLEPIKETN